MLTKPDNSGVRNSLRISNAALARLQGYRLLCKYFQNFLMPAMLTSLTGTEVGAR